MDETISYYEKAYGEFIAGTLEADTEKLRSRFLRRLAVPGTSVEEAANATAARRNIRILDFGCGSGRDSRAFLEAGYQVCAMDGSGELCRAASEYTGLAVKCMDFFALDEEEAYDGIWACASVLHVEKSRIPELLRILYRALRKGGVLYLSFKYGDHNGMRDGRHFTDLNEGSFRELLGCVYGEEISEDDFRIVDEWRSVDVRRGKNVQWLNEILIRQDMH